MRRRFLIATCFALSTLTYQAFAGKKVEFNATVRADIACELGYRIVHVNKKGSTDEYCAIGPKAAGYYLEQNVDKEVNIKGHDGTQTIGGNQILVMWIDRIGGNKVRDYDPCHISTTYAILAGLNGQTPQLPPGCTGGASSSSSGADQSANTVQESSPSQATNSYPSEQSNAGTSSPRSSSGSGPSSHLVSGLPQCAHSQYENADLWIVNNCNVPLTVYFTSDSGRVWGSQDVGPSTRHVVEIMGFYNPQKDGRVYIFPCPKGDTPAMPDGNFWMPRNYKGEYTCYQP